MASEPGEIPAIESSGLFGVLSSPMGISRRNTSYDALMEAPMHSPPSDISVNTLWKEPVIPRHKFRDAVEEKGSSVNLLNFEEAAPARVMGPVVKAKATSLMSSIMIKQTQENLQEFEHQAGLTDVRYSPHRGLSAEETQFHRLGDLKPPLQKLRMPSGDFKEDRLTTSAQSTPIGTPSVTPCAEFRAWFQLSPAALPTSPEANSPNPSTDMGGNEGGGGGERWNFFGTRSVVQKSPTDPGSDSSSGFSLQSYFGMQKSSTMDSSSTAGSFKVDDPASFMPPKIEITDLEAKQAPPPRPHKLKPRDMNVLTPSGF
uniref:Putative monooxygenase p33MONOX n=1 Tax=Tetraodon nigroviridis TaxID=99883 RepID=H3CYS7_TETNG